MVRMILRVGSLSLLAIPWAILERQFVAIDGSRAWVTHTLAARRLASSIERSACSPRADLGAIRAECLRLESFTSDNPGQSRRAGLMAEAAGRGDLGSVSSLAIEAESEEDRLLDSRRATAIARVQAVRGSGKTTLGMVLTFLVGWEVAEWLLRAVKPPAKGGGR